jgi:Tol biopolymer transport system component
LVWEEDEVKRLSCGVLIFLAAAVALPWSAHAAGTVNRAGLDPLQVRLAITENFNVSFVNGFGGAKRVVTSKGTGYNGVWYPHYAWSFDGKYLLLIRNSPTSNHGTRSDLLLLDSTGAVLRTLAQPVASADFQPGWATDADQIAYVAWQKFLKNGAKPYNAVDVVDVQGNKRSLWGYRSTGEGCGGGTSDPAAQKYSAETGFGGVPQSLVWSTSRHLAIYSASCAGGLAMIDLRTRQTHLLGQASHPWNEAALSRNGILAATVGACAPTRCSTKITLVNTKSGAIVGNAGAGELPAWSLDGRTLYFTEQTPGKVLQLKDQLGNKVQLVTNITSIWRANANGTHLLRLVSADAYGFGPLSLTPDGTSLIYSSVDNDWNLYNHRLAGNRYTDALLKQYGPKVQVMRFDSGKRPVVIAPSAGQPAVQP